MKKKNEEREAESTKTEDQPTEDKGGKDGRDGDGKDGVDSLLIAIIAGAAIVFLLLVFLIVRCGRPKVQIIQKDDNAVFCPEDVIDFDGDNSWKSRKENLFTNTASAIN